MPAAQQAVPRPGSERVVVDGVGEAVRSRGRAEQRAARRHEPLHEEQAPRHRALRRVPRPQVPRARPLLLQRDLPARVRGAPLPSGKLSELVAPR